MRHPRRAWVPWLAAILLAGCATDEAPTDLYELSGYVRQALSGAAVSGARVTFVSDTLYEASTTTDDDGFYEMTVETDTPFGQVRAEKDGFVRSEATVYFDTPARRIDLSIREVPADEE